MASKEIPTTNVMPAVQADPAKGTQPTKRHARVTVFANWCKGCGLCVAFCPKKVFEEDAEGHPVVAHPEWCTACNWCTMHCPDFAIVLKVEDERVEGTSARTEEVTE